MNKQLKLVSIVFVIFTIISVSITCVLIKNNIQNVCIENSNKEEISLNKEKGIDLYGTYNENDLIINDLLETFSGDEIKIPQIEGLKNKQVEAKINQEIYKRCYESIKDTIKNVVEFYEIDYYYNVMANFSNVISINYYFNIDGNINHIYLNYNLVTGERLKFEDLFVKDSDIIGIVRKAFLERIFNNNYWENVIEGDYIASFDENELYKIVKGFMENDEKEFMFTPSTIYIYFKNYGALFEMIDISDSISIYTKYLTDESIYDRNDIGRKNIFTLAETNYDMFDTIDYGYLEDNFWYDVTVNKMYFPDGQVEAEKMKKFNAYVGTLTDEVYEKVNDCREIAKKNPDKFYILICTPNVSIYNDSKYENGEWTYTYSNMAVLNLNTKIYEMPMELYDSEYKDIIIDAYRHKYFVMRGGMYYSIGEPQSGDNVIYTKNEEQRKYNYMTNKEINDLSDIFYEDVNYMEIVEEMIRKEIRERYERTEGEIEELLKSARYDFQGWNIKVDIPQIEYFSLNIYLENFEKSMLNIFDKED